MWLTLTSCLVSFGIIAQEPAIGEREEREDLVTDYEAAFMGWASELLAGLDRAPDAK